MVCALQFNHEDEKFVKHCITSFLFTKARKTGNAESEQCLTPHETEVSSISIRYTSFVGHAGNIAAGQYRSGYFGVLRTEQHLENYPLKHVNLLSILPRNRHEKELRGSYPPED